MSPTGILVPLFGIDEHQPNVYNQIAYIPKEVILLNPYRLGSDFMKNNA